MFIPIVVSLPRGGDARQGLFLSVKLSNASVIDGWETCFRVSLVDPTGSLHVLIYFSCPSLDQYRPMNHSHELLPNAT